MALTGLQNHLCKEIYKKNHEARNTRGSYIRYNVSKAAELIINDNQSFSLWADDSAQKKLRTRNWNREGEKVLYFVIERVANETENWFIIHTFPLKNVV